MSTTPELDAVTRYVRSKRAIDFNLGATGNRAALRGLVGAGIGAGVGGLGSMALNRGLDEDDKRRSNPYSAALKGALFGGALNAGGGFLWDRYNQMKQPTTSVTEVVPDTGGEPPITVGLDPGTSSGPSRLPSMINKEVTGPSRVPSMISDQTRSEQGVSSLLDFIKSLQPTDGTKGTSGSTRSLDWSN